MDNINQAFMRVYSKRRPVAKSAPAVAAANRLNSASQTESSAKHPAVEQPLQAGPNQGIWRVDSPETAAQQQSHRVPAPHAAFAPVQHVETYDLEAIQDGQAVSRVVLADNITLAGSDALETDGGETSAIPERDAQSEQASSVPADSEQDNQPVAWVFELDVRPSDDGLESAFNTRPIVALDAPVELCDAPREVRIALSAAQPVANAATRQQAILPASAQDAPTLEPLNTQVAPAPDRTESTSPEAPILRMADSSKKQSLLDPDIAPDAVPLNDAQSPEQLNQLAVEMDAAPSIPFPEPEWATNTAATHSIVATVELPAESFAPAWEVDQFHWPEVCAKLEQILDDTFQQSGEALYEATRNELRVLGVTSAERREGRTTLALTLARTAARAGAHVALLDADTANPDVARQLGIEAPCSWVDAATGAQPLSEAAVLSLEDDVTLLPLITPVDDVSKGIVDAQLAATLRQARQEFDLVIMDMHPIDDRDIGAFRQLAQCPIDMAIVVRNINTTSKNETLQTVAHLHAMGVPAVGIAENFTPNQPT